jgi:hypothetical protein
MSREKDLAKQIPIEGVMRSLGISVRDRSSRYIRMPCPFHRSKDEDFVIDTDKNLCYCMSPGCEYHSALDPMALVMKTQGVTFPKALEILLGGQAMNYKRPDARPEEPPEKKLAKIANIFRASQAPDGIARAEAYWTGRGLPKQVVRDYRLGYYLAAPIRTSMRYHYRFSIPWFSGNTAVAISGRLDEQWATEHLSQGELQEDAFGSKYMGPAVDKKNRVFNNRRLYQDGKYLPWKWVFVNESEADCMSVEWVGHQPCVVSKTSPHIETLMENVDIPIIIAQRDHGAGMFYAQGVQSLISKPAPIFEVPSPYKDANEMAIAGVLKEWIDEILTSMVGYDEARSRSSKEA